MVCLSNLVIVESPAKAKTIKKYLGKDFEVVASMGHVRDLPKSKFGVDVDHDFTPMYVDIKGKEDLIKDLKRPPKKRRDFSCNGPRPRGRGDFVASGADARRRYEPAQPCDLQRDHKVGRQIRNGSSAHDRCQACRRTAGAPRA